MRTIRVLLVDDHSVLREGIRKLLEQEPDIEVVGEAADGPQAIALANVCRPDVVLMDVLMPGLTGIEATRQIKKSNPSTAVLILSAYDDDRYVIGLLEAGAAGYLLKCAFGREIVQALRTVHAGESVLHPTVAARLLARAARSPSLASSLPSDEPLTQRELQVLRLAARGDSNKGIASKLVLSVPTVKAHLVNIFSKIGVASRTEAVVEGLRRGWIDSTDLPTENASPGQDAAPVREHSNGLFRKGAASY